MNTYTTIHLYQNNDMFTTRWQGLQGEVIFVHKHRLVWLGDAGRTIIIPKESGEYFFFERAWLVWVQESGVILGKRVDDNESV
jgi:RNase P/RNase MRP subunit p29